MHLTPFLKVITAGCLVVAFSALSPNIFAQQVTFNLNLEPQLKDSTFVPGRDILQITGSEYPLNTPAPPQMRDTAPTDSIYSVVLRFSPRLKGKVIQYNFEMIIDGQKRTETLPRSVLIPDDKSDLEALYFDAFAW